jgi:HlyD family secretion protein
MQTKMKRILLLSACTLAVASLAGCSASSSKVFQGYIEGEYVYVASPLGGALTNLAVARGEEVKTGQLLFELERGSEAAAVQQAEKNLAQAQSQLDDLNKGKRPTEITSLEAQLERTQANLKMAAAEFERRVQLGSADVVSREELDQARAQRDTDQAQVDQMTADLETAKLGGREDAVRAAQAAVESQTAALDKARWSYDQKQQGAPTNALVQDTLYRDGEWVAAGNPVVELLPPTNIKVRFFVPQAVLPRIKPGQVVSVTFDGGQRAYPATVNYLSTEAEFTPPVLYNRENRAKLIFMIEATFALADAAELRPGQPVDVEVK